MKQRLLLLIVRALIPTDPKARKKFIKVLLPGSHLSKNPVRKVKIESYDRETKAHAEIHRECDEYRVANGQKPVEERIPLK